MDQSEYKKDLIFLDRLKCCKSQYRTTSSILNEIVHEKHSLFSISELSERLGDRGLGIILLLLALPNTIPLPIPGISTITGIPLIFFAAQLCFGSQKLWLPECIGGRKVNMASLQPFFQRALPFMLFLERFIKPRLDSITTIRFERIAGGFILLLACLIALPIPLGNLPLGIAITILALAITERDGVLMIIGWIFTFLALSFFLLLVSGYIWLVLQALNIVI